MKRNVLFAIALSAILSVSAQNIAVVSPSNTTTIYQSLDEAVSGAIGGSTIYLPGGGFQIKDETLIDKKLTIMGVSHRGDTDNVDGATIISGNLNFVKGANGSAVLGVYVSGNINVGTATDSVTNLTVRYCNVNSIQVKHHQSSGMVVNQSYLRAGSDFGNTNVKITNCVTNYISSVNGGTIDYNIILGSGSFYRGYLTYSVGMNAINGSNITGNIFSTAIHYINGSYGVDHQPSNCTGRNNYGASWGDDPIDIGVSLSDLFENWNNGAIAPTSNFHFKKEYKEYENKVGIYGGSKFRDDTSLAPIPRIISKKVAESTDSSGQLQIEIKVKAQ